MTADLRDRIRRIRDEHKRNNPLTWDGICHGCLEDLPEEKHERKFCSKRCAGKWSIGKRGTTTPCPECGTPKPPKNAVYCSKPCAAKASIKTWPPTNRLERRRAQWREQARRKQERKVQERENARRIRA